MYRENGIFYSRINKIQRSILSGMYKYVITQLHEDRRPNGLYVYKENKTE